MIGKHTSVFAYQDLWCTFCDMTSTPDKDWELSCMLNPMEVLGCSSKFIQTILKREMSNT